MASYFLTNAERKRLSLFPSLISEEDLISFFTLSASDRIEIEKLRGAHNRFGFSLQICILRYLGFLPHDLISVPIEVIKFIEEQLNLSVECLTDYGKRPQTRQEHLKSVLDYLGLRRANSTDWKNLRTWLVGGHLNMTSPHSYLVLPVTTCIQIKYYDRVYRALNHWLLKSVKKHG
jgi:hypothetical protein